MFLVFFSKTACSGGEKPKTKTQKCYRVYIPEYRISYPSPITFIVAYIISGKYLREGITDYRLLDSQLSKEYENTTKRHTETPHQW